MKVKTIREIIFCLDHIHYLEKEPMDFICRVSGYGPGKKLSTDEITKISILYNVLNGRQGITAGTDRLHAIPQNTGQDNG